MSADGLIVWCAPGPDSSRRRLPNRRECFTEDIVIGGRRYSASVGFDPVSGDPQEIFLSGAKSGSDMDANLADAAIFLSKTLQLGLRAGELTTFSALSSPEGVTGSLPSSAISAALDLVARYEAEEWRNPAAWLAEAGISPEEDAEARR